MQEHRKSNRQRPKRGFSQDFSLRYLGREIKKRKPLKTPGVSLKAEIEIIKLHVIAVTNPLREIKHAMRAKINEKMTIAAKNLAISSDANQKHRTVIQTGLIRKEKGLKVSKARISLRDAPQKIGLETLLKEGEAHVLREQKPQQTANQYKARVLEARRLIASLKLQKMRI